ncbi:hypothetical protein FOA52_000480 [Chlamydomonas sp. UWO 241]|nr:hypothetical protein FOA52_000480 [Chlamydomonas sp. UWO 241]
MAAAASVGMDAAARGGGASGNMSVAMALRRAFQETDSLVCAADAGAGSTAVTAVICRSTLWVASVGDSRAVLCRGGAAVALTEDHKPEREDEAARVQAAGGRILFNRGARVGGVLAMTRALGDHHLRCSGVVAEPDVSVTARDRVHDEFLLLASDGLWDVMSNQEAVNLASRCLERAAARGAKRSAACRVASTVLSRAALERGSRDNVTVAVVDLVGR